MCIRDSYYTVWSKSAVANADCSLKKYIYCVIYYNFRHTIVPYSRLWPDGVVQSAHYFRRFGDLFRWFLHLNYMLNVLHISTAGLFDLLTPASIIPTKFEVDITIHCRVIAFLSAHTSRDLVTLTCHLLTLNSWRAWRVTWQTLPPSLNTLRLSVLDLWVITFPFGYHRECVRGHCACAESRDPWVGGQNQLHFWNSRPRFAYSLYKFPWATTTIKVRLISSVTNVKAPGCVNFLCVTLWPWPFDL